MSRPVVLVVDTGVDDALALVVAAWHPDLDLRAVVATAGNASLGRVLANTAHVLGCLRSDAPLAAGPGVRLDGSPFPVRSVHGPDGLAGAGPTAPLDPVRFPAPAAVLPYGATLVSLGPLTALAGLAVERATGARLSVVAACARPGEANHAMDPGAAAAVGTADIEVLHDGGGAFAAPRVPDEVAVAMSRSADPVTSLVGYLLRHQVHRGVGIGDAGVVLRLAEPGIGAGGAAARLVALAGG